MTLDQYRSSLAAAVPPETDLALQALWWAGKGNWEAAHARAQQAEGEPRCDWVHAYLHRLEGDAVNARYWYRRAGQPVATTPPDQEWTAIAAALLA